MDIRKRLLGISCILSLFPSSVIGQEWNIQDSLKLQQILKSDQEIIINKSVVKKAEQNILRTKMFANFDPALPTLKSPYSFRRQYINSNILFQQSISNLSPTCSWLRINKKFFLQSNSNYAENSNHFHIQTQMEYKLTKRWCLNTYAIQNIDFRKYQGLPNEITPTVFSGNIVFNVNKHCKIKTGILYQYNAIRKKWEWIPQASIVYEW